MSVAAHQFGQFFKVDRSQQAAGRVVRGIDDDHPRFRGDQGRYLRPVRRVIREAQLGIDRLAADRFDGRHVGVVHRREDDHLVARPDEGGNRREERLGRPGGHRHLGFDVEARAIERRHLVDDRLAQFRHAGHRRVLVAPGAHVAIHGVEQRRLGLKVGKALRQVERPALGRHTRHHGEDGRPHVREAGIDADRGLHVGPALPTVAVDREKKVKIMRQGGPAGNHGAKNSVVLHPL